MSTRKTRVIILGVVLVLASAALVGCGSSASADGVQRIAVSANGVFEPYPVQVQAGVPLEIEFGQGSGCTQAINIPQFGVSEDLTRGGATVELPALEPGVYDLICQSNMVMGQIVAQ